MTMLVNKLTDRFGIEYHHGAAHIVDRTRYSLPVPPVISFGHNTSIANYVVRRMNEAELTVQAAELDPHGPAAGLFKLAQEFAQDFHSQ